MDIDECLVSPGEAFYATCSPAQVDTVVEALTRDREFPHAFTFLGDGAAVWDRRLENARPEFAALIRQFDALIGDHAEELLAAAPPERAVRVVDLGPGTAEPVQGLIGCLVAHGRFAGYRGIDVSPAVLEIARQRLRDAFPGRSLEWFEGDFTGPDLDGVLATGAGDDAIRFFVLAGNTLCNLPDPGRFLRRLSEVMTPDDQLLVTMRVDTGTNRPPFMDRINTGGRLTFDQGRGLDLLGIDPDWFEAERGYDPDRCHVFVRARFTRPVAVDIGTTGGVRRVSFAVGDTVLLFRQLFVDQAGIVDILKRADLAARLFRTDSTGEMALIAAAAGEPIGSPNHS